MRYDALKYERVRNLRNDRELSQSVIAKYLGISQSAYSKYELSERNMTPEVLIKLADFHNTSIDYLLNRTNNPSPPLS